MPPSDEAAGNSSGRSEAVDWDLLLEEQTDLWSDAATDPRTETEREQLGEEPLSRRPTDQRRRRPPLRTTSRPR